jgi:transcriptional regulator with XRE-family HTH domain
MSSRKVHTDPSQPDFGEQFARIRGARKLSKAGLARLSGLSITTIARAESSAECPLNSSSMLLVLKALANSTPPLNTSEAVWLASVSGLDRAAAISLVPVDPKHEDMDTIQLAVSELLETIGPGPLVNVLSGVLDAVRASRQPRSVPRARSLIVKSPPVQRDGFTEETETEYEVAEAPPQVPKRKAAEGM